MRIILILFLTFLLGCSTPSWINYNNPKQEIVYYNIDSVCAADGISPNLKYWKELSLRDYEDNSKVTKYLYIKDSIIYIRTDSTIIKRL